LQVGKGGLPPLKVNLRLNQIHVERG
jgi:hypothetical protein